MSEILVMGGSTFVGSSVAKYLIGKGHAVDILTRGLKEIKYKGYRDHITCDRKNQDELKKAIGDKKYSYIFDISAYTKEEVEKLINVLNKESVKKFIFISSGAVYKHSDSIISEDYDIDENEAWGRYGIDKAEAEVCIKNSKLPYAIFRPSYIYGEENNIYREAYIFDRIRENKIVPMPYGNNTKTQFIYIEDVVKAFESAMYSSKEKGTYNLTYPENISWELLIDTCSLAANKAAKIEKVESGKYDSRSYFPFRDVSYMLDIKKLMNDGLYVPQVNLIEGLKKSYKWYIDNNIKLADKKMDKVDEVIRNSQVR